jgi:ribonucleoside-diphosphate reductase alpha chain
MHTYDEVYQASLEYFGGDELAASVFASKYSLPTLDGGLLEMTPADMHKRIAGEFSRIESGYENPMSYEEIFDLLSDWKIIPQGSPLSGIGNNNQVQSLSNCFVVAPPEAQGSSNV